MGKKTKKVTIVVLNYNGKQDTLECLGSLRKLKQEKTKSSILVVDNGSSDGSVAAIRRQFPQIEIAANKTNLGFCEGNNLGAEIAFKKDCDYVLILNNDTLAHPGLVENIVKTALKKKADVLSPKIYFAPEFEFHKNRYKKSEKGKVIWYAGGQIDWNNILPSHRGVDQVDNGQFDEAQATEFVTGCATLVSRKAYSKLGLYDPIFFAYFEDADFSLRAKNASFRVFYAPQASLWHKNASTFGGSGSPFQDYFITRNRLIFGLRYAPTRAKAALLRESLKYLIKGPARKRRAIKDGLLRSLPDISTIG